MNARQTVTRSLRAGVLLLALGILATGAAAPATAQAQGDSLPAGAISFFNLKQCPDGWAPLTQADGLLTVPLVEGAGNGGISGTALVAGAQPKHKHGIAASIHLPSTNFVGIAGCCNEHLADSGTKNWSGTTDESTTGLPYVELMLCMKTAGASATAPPPPRGTLIYMGFLSCPSGWTQNLTTQGRFPVGLPDKGTPGLSFGGAPLKPLEQRTHTHAFSGSVALKSRDVALASGCCADGYGKNGTYSYHGTSAGAASDFPYIQLLQCEKL